MNMAGNRRLGERESTTRPRSNSTHPEIEKDKCWGWLVVVGCLLVHLFVGGLDRSYGMLETQWIFCFCVK